MNLGTYVERRSLNWLEGIVNDSFSSLSIDPPRMVQKREGSFYTIELVTPFRIPVAVMQEIKTRIFNEGWKVGAMEKENGKFTFIRKPPHFRIYSYNKQDIDFLKNIIEDSYHYNKEQIPKIVECQRGKEFYLQLETRFVPKPVYDQVIKRWNLRNRS